MLVFHQHFGLLRINQQCHSGGQFIGAILIGCNFIPVEAFFGSCGNDLHIGQACRNIRFPRIVVKNDQTDNIAVFQFAGETSCKGRNGNTDCLFLAVQSAEHIICTVRSRRQFAGKQCVANLQIAGGKLTDYMFFLRNCSGGKAITADSCNFDVFFCDEVPLLHILFHTDDIGATVRKLIHQRCNTKGYSQGQHDAHDTDNGSVFHWIPP